VLRGVKSFQLNTCTQVRVKLMQFTEVIIQTCHATAVLDCVLSLAVAAIDRNWCVTSHTQALSLSLSLSRIHAQG